MQLPQYDKCVLDHRYWLGTLADYSGHGNDGVATNCHWERRRGDDFVNFKDNAGRVTVSADSSLISDEYTLVIYGDLDLSGSHYGRYLSMRTGGGVRFDFYKNSSVAALYLYNGTSTVNIGSVYAGLSSIIISINTTDCSLYYDGALHNAVNYGIGSAEVDLLIGNIYTGTFPSDSPFKGVLVYNTVLTAEEIAQVHAWTEQARTPHPPKRHFIFPSTISKNSIDGIVDGYTTVEHGQVVSSLGVKTPYSSSGSLYKTKTPWGTPAIGAGETGLATLEYKYEDVVLRAEENDFSISFWMWSPNNANVKYPLSYYNGYPYWYFSVVGNNLTFRLKDSSLAVFEAKYTFDDIAGKWHMITVTIDRSANATLFIDGEQVASVDITSFADASMLSTYNDICLFSNGTGINPLGAGMKLADVMFFDRLLSPHEIKAIYQKYAKLPTYFEHLPRESLTTWTGAGSYLDDSGWQIQSGSWEIKGDSVERYTVGGNLLTDGDMEDSGTSAWAAGAGAILSKETANPKEGIQCLRVTLPGGVSSVFASQPAGVSGLLYRVRGWARGDGSNTLPYVHSTSAGTLWSGTTSSSWQYFDVVFEQVYGNINLFAYNNITLSGYADFDDVSVEKIKSTDRVIECISSGQLSIPSQVAYGTWEFDLYQAHSYDNVIVVFATTDISPWNGYEIRLSSLRRLQFYRWDAGAAAKTIYRTNDDYVTVGIWYSLRVTRRYDGQFTVYIKGGSFGNDWVLAGDVVVGSNPAIDNTHTNSRYIVLDLDAGDKIANLKHYVGVIEP